MKVKLIFNFTLDVLNEKEKKHSKELSIFLRTARITISLNYNFHNYDNNNNTDNWDR